MMSDVCLVYSLSCLPTNNTPRRPSSDLLMPAAEGASGPYMLRWLSRCLALGGDRVVHSQAPGFSADDPRDACARISRVRLGGMPMRVENNGLCAMTTISNSHSLSSQLTILSHRR